MPVARTMFAVATAGVAMAVVLSTFLWRKRQGDLRTVRLKDRFVAWETATAVDKKEAQVDADLELEEVEGGEEQQHQLQQDEERELRLGSPAGTTAAVEAASTAADAPANISVRALSVGGQEKEKEKQQEELMQYLRDLRRDFVKRKASIPAVHLAMRSLTPTSRCLWRGPTLCEGTFGTVTSVKHDFHGRFALKELLPGADEGARISAVQEVRVLIGLMNHPQVVSMKAFNLTTQRMPILLELASCDASDILLRRWYCYPMLQQISIVQDAVCGLMSLHQFGYVHVDFKPENLLVFQTRSQLRGKISDFGLSRQSGVIRPALTGTPAYMPPANLKMDLPAAVEQDVFSAAVVTMLVLLRPPLKGANLFALDSLQTDEEVVRAKKIDRHAADEQIAFQIDVMLRTTADGSFSRKILVPESLQDSVPSPEKVCEWLEAMLDPCTPHTMGDIHRGLNEIIVNHSKLTRRNRP